jgi:hypothetical protein
MGELGTEGVSRRGKRKIKKIESEMPAAPDLVRRNFRASRPDELWIADIERHEALLYRAVVKEHRLRPVVAGR